MRVIGGSARGVPLKGPLGPETRATSDKVRGAIFNVLAPYLADAHVLDLYAGTGALGIEALSRGAAACLFVEKAAPVCRVIEANLRAAKVGDRAAVLCMPVERALDRLASLAVEVPPVVTAPATPVGNNPIIVESGSTFAPPYDVIVLDPPYGDMGAVEVVERIARAGLVELHGFVVLEHGKRMVPPLQIGALRQTRTRRYGDTVVTVWQRSDEDAEV